MATVSVLRWLLSVYQDGYCAKVVTLSAEEEEKEERDKEQEQDEREHEAEDFNTPTNEDLSLSSPTGRNKKDDKVHTKEFSKDTV